MSSASVLPALQSGFWRGYSTETAVLRMLSNTLLAVDRGDLAALILLDLTAAFDTVSPTTLNSGYNRTWSDGHSTYDVEMPSQPSLCLCVEYHRGSVLGPILFIIYTVDLISVNESHGLSPHMYADDGSCCPAAVDALSSKISECVGAVASPAGCSLADCH